jgi:arylsulfatase
MVRLTLFASLALLAACNADEPAASASAPGAGRPNILLIVVDDMGYSDLGSFGGEIATPNLDRLAFDGVRFSNLVASPMGSPSRAMLLTGVDAHRAGFGNMAEELAPNQKGQAGYEGHPVDRVVTLPKLVHMASPWGTDAWQLFDADADPGESQDLGARHPDVLASLVPEWDRYATGNGVILPDWVSGY